MGVLCCVGRGQTIDDGVMLAKGALCGGYMYTYDRWTEYWEGSRKRINGNIGTITTQGHQLFANYGVTTKLNVLAHVSHVRTNASQGVLAGQNGFQDATFAVSTGFSTLRLPNAAAILVKRRPSPSV